MTGGQFQQSLNEARRTRPKAFEAMVPVPPASDDQIEALERLLGCSLESSHKEFLQVFGGGEFGFGMLFCADPDSEWFVAAQLQELDSDVSSFVPVSDNFAGDVYGFLVKDGKCEGPLVIWDHEIGAVRRTEFDDVFEFMDRYALRPA